MGIAVYAEKSEYKMQAQELAEHLNISMIMELPDKSDEKLVLLFNGEGLSLVGGSLNLHADFTRMIHRIKMANLHGELLVRAAKIKDAESRPIAIDATAGLGEDSILLAAVGYSVKLYERNPVISALLKDALKRAEKNPELAEVVGRMELFEQDSITALSDMKEKADIIFLDPMFPARQKSALVKKKFQLLQHLEQPCADEDELIKAAIAAGPRKIIIKRPSKGPYLAGIKPNYSIEGKGIRYDCLVFA